MSRTLVLVASALAAILISATAAEADSVVIEVGEDTSPYSFVPNLARYNNPTMYAFQTVDVPTGTPHEFETFLWFDVSAADIPPGQGLTDALLVVTYGFDFTGFGETSTDPGQLDCREVLAPWNETTLNWNNRPASDVPFDSVVGISAFGALVCDATDIVASWIYGGVPNNGFALTSPTERVMGMYSLEAAVDPSLMPTLYLTTEVPEPNLILMLAPGVLALRAMRGRSGSAARQRAPVVVSK